MCKTFKMLMKKREKYYQVVGFYWQNVTLPLVSFKHFASKNQLPGFYISGT